MAFGYNSRTGNERGADRDEDYQEYKDLGEEYASANKKYEERRAARKKEWNKLDLDAKYDMIDKEAELLRAARKAAAETATARVEFAGRWRTSEGVTEDMDHGRENFDSGHDQQVNIYDRNADNRNKDLQNLKREREMLALNHSFGKTIEYTRY